MTLIPQNQASLIILLMQQSGSRFEREQERLLKMQQTSNETCLRTIQIKPDFETTLLRFQNYVPSSNCVDIAQLRSSKHLKVKKSKDYSYYGEVLDGMRQGAGIMLYGRSAVYEGGWLIDRKHGMGYQLYQSGNSYEGEFVAGKRQGTGVFRWKNGEIYDGEWLNDKKEGTGTWKSLQGDSYVGEWKDSKSHGFGVHVWSNGDRYEGQFRNCLKHGFGYERNASGDLYKGNFQMGQKNGHGEYFWADGSCYSGEFKNGKKQGKGLWKSGKGLESYEGNYKNGNREGYGVYLWANGTIYKGNYRQNIRQGYGEMFWPSGEHYKGFWKADKQHGEAQTYAPIGIQTQHSARNAISDTFEHDQEPKIASIQLKQPQAKGLHQRVFNNTAYNSIESKVKVYTKPKSPAHQNNIFICNSSDHRKARQTINSKSKNNKTSRKYLTWQNQSKQGQSQPVKKGTLSSQADSPINAYRANYRKQSIPHSSYYIHRIDRRVKTEIEVGRDESSRRRFSFGKLQPQPGPQPKSYNLTKLLHPFRLPHTRLY